MLCWQVGRFSCIVPREGSGVFPFFSLRNGPVLPPPCRSEPEVCRMPAAAARAAARALPARRRKSSRPAVSVNPIHRFRLIRQLLCRADCSAA